MTVINGTSGNDTIDISGDVGTLNGVHQGGPITGIDGKEGYETITVSNSTVSGTIDSGVDGMDLSVTGSDIGQIKTSTGTSDITTSNSSVNYLDFGSGPVTMTATNTDINIIDTSTGPVTMNWTGGTMSGAYNGGSGSDSLTFTNVTINDFIAFDAAGGNDTLTFENTTIGDNFFLQVGSGDNTVNIADGTSFGTSASFDATNLGTNQINLPDGSVLTIDGMGSYIVGSDTLPSGSNLNGSFILPNGSGANFTDFDEFGATAAPVCFTEGTLILTPTGEIAVEELAVGDLVITAEGAAVPIRWLFARDMVFSGNQVKHQPVLIKSDALGPGMPERDLALSPQHCVLIESAETLRAFGLPRVFVRAKWLTGLPGIRVMQGRKKSRYITFLLDHHQILRANGAWTESFYPGPMAMLMLPPKERAAVRAICATVRNSDEAGDEARCDSQDGLTYALNGGLDYGPRAARVLTRSETAPLLRALRHASERVDLGQNQSAHVASPIAGPAQASSHRIH